MKVEVAGISAWVQPDKNVVIALSTVTLQQPIRRANDITYIARQDVPAFLTGFKIDARVTTATTATAVPPPAPAPTTSRPEPAPPVETLNNQTARRTPGLRTLTPRPAVDRPIRRIMIDAGHGGADLGVEAAIGPAGEPGLAEKEVTLMLASALQQELSSKVEPAIDLSRSEDADLSTQQRTTLAAKNETDLIISLHVGGSLSPQARGAAIFYPPENEDDFPRYSITSVNAPVRERYRDPGAQSREIAAAVGDAIESSEVISLRGVYEAPCQLLSAAAVPGLLVEVGCITNPADAALLTDPAALQQIAAQIAEGVANYLGGRKTAAKEIQPVEP
jgi:N-acetylmuramoyl-L-alanine amidase